ncbi:hypothetical protein AXG93_3719s1230 [Marchantia polymorpha subsp. ruderalis]|uniref:FANCL UBC-like domain-containing protein n=1 Tax=Marchantia polymorpha subsp. ruderalis TaxID=1480154 RepID=A0A176VNS3_MARPO|nr:hypothetical protein AXG93_3719s1230 [Marchantia polymorpha subsp. ruderalis]
MEPLFLPLNCDFTAYHVLLPMQGKEFSFSVHNIPRDKASLQHAMLECNEELRTILRGVEPVVQERLKQSYDLSTFVLELKDILERIVRTQPFVSLPTPAFYSQLCANLDSVGWEHLIWLSDELSSLHLRIFDSAGREHIVLVDLPPGFPEVAPTASANLPIPVDLRSLQGESLKDIILQYESAIETYQDFWDVMEDVDKRVWVMEPDHPSRADAFRRIALGGHCSLSIVVDPLSPRSVPECRFFGSDAVISPLRRRLNSGLRKWDRSRPLIANFEEVLEITFPSAQETDKEDMSADCGICYAYRAQDGHLMFFSGIAPIVLIR